MKQLKTFALSLVALTLAWASLGTLHGAPTKVTPIPGTVTVNGKVLKNVEVHEGVNLIPLPDGHQVKVELHNGKLAKPQILDAKGNPVRKGAVGPKGLCFHICVFGACFDVCI